MGMRVNKRHDGTLVHRVKLPDGTYEAAGKHHPIRAERPKRGFRLVHMKCPTCGMDMRFAVHSVGSTWCRRMFKLVPFTFLLLVQIVLVNLSLENDSIADMLRSVFFGIMVFVQVIMLALLFTGQGLTHLRSVRKDGTIDVNVHGHQLR